MAKIYTQVFKSNKGLNPKQETINFLLNYSKSLEIKKSRNFEIEINKN